MIFYFFCSLWTNTMWISPCLHRSSTDSPALELNNFCWRQPGRNCSNQHLHFWLPRTHLISLTGDKQWPGLDQVSAPHIAVYGPRAAVWRLDSDHHESRGGWLHRLHGDCRQRCRRCPGLHNLCKQRWVSLWRTRELKIWRGLHAEDFAYVGQSYYI